MPVHPPITIPVDPHVLAQWRFDERRRWEDQRDPALQAVSMVLGRWPDRLEFRTRAEVPGVSDSARAVAAAADAPAYRAQLLEIVTRIVQTTGVTDAPHAEAEPAPAPAHADGHPEAGDGDDWLSRLDARLSSAPAPAPAARDAAQVAPPPPALQPAADLPDFLAPWESAPAAADPAPPQDDDAFYVPPAAAPPHAAPAAEAPHAATPAVPVLDFVVEPDEAPSGNGSAAAPDATAADPFDTSVAFDPPYLHPDPAPQPAAAHEPAYGFAAAEPEPAPAHAAETPPAPAFVAGPPAEAPAAAALHAPAAAPSPSPAQPAHADAGGVTERLAALGRDMGLGVWGRGVAAHSAGDRPAVDASVQALLDSLDVVWTQDGRFVGAFLVAPRPAVNGLLLIADVVSLQPGVAIPFFVVAPRGERAELRHEASRPTFAALSPPLAGAVRFIAAERLDESLANVSAFLRYLRPEFVEALAEEL